MPVIKISTHLFFPAKSRMQADELGDVLCAEPEPFSTPNMTYKILDPKEDPPIEETR